MSCHTISGDAADTRMVFVHGTNANHESVNLAVFEDFLRDVDGAANLVLEKVQGVDHEGVW